MSKHSITVTINMMAHGMKTLITTTQEKIDFYMDDYKNSPDTEFAHGRGKMALKNHILQNIFELDGYFDRNPAAINTQPQLWSNFREDCILFATLDSYLSGDPLPIVKLAGQWQH